jgi:GT2 family glycosyltransferase
LPGVVLPIRILRQSIDGGVDNAWLRLSYSQSFLSQPARPLLRLKSADGSVLDHVMPAAVFGRARWFGPVPRNLIELELYVYQGPPEHFRVDRVEWVGAIRRQSLLIRRSPIGFLENCVRRLLYGRDRADHHLRGVINYWPLKQIGRFAVARHRPIENDGLDHPPAPTHHPMIEFLIVANQSDERRLGETLGSLARQACPDWRVTIGVHDRSAPSFVRLQRSIAPICDRLKVIEIDPNASDQVAIAQLIASSSGALVGILEAGDVLAPETTLALGGFLDSGERAAVVYTDSALMDRRGRLTAPQLKPDWSPELFRHIDYIGGLCLFDGDLGRTVCRSLPTETHDAKIALVFEIAARVGGARIRHLRRVLLHDGVLTQSQPDKTHRPPQRQPRSNSLLEIQPAPEALRVGTGQMSHLPVSIIIPTRDRLDLLGRAVESVRKRTTYPNYDILVVDNASTDQATIEYLAARQQTGEIDVITDQGSFNFSRLVNAAVAHTANELIVLLNNDTYVIEPGWLDELVAHALQCDVGAVGAKLLYPNGRIQHAGVVVGVGGYSGHVHRRLAADHIDHVGRLRVPHEVSAVTAACLAVRRQNWDGVGGFDETFVVDFNDIDFCLRLRRRGLRNIWTPHAVLGHEESASRRGDTGTPTPRFIAEAKLFAARWQDEIQADPYFSPALSLRKTSEVLE